MILSIEEREQIAKECEKDFEKIENYRFVTSVPEEGKPYLLKLLYSESKQHPGILVRLAECEGLGKSKFKKLVKKLNAERKQFAINVENQDNYYNIVAKFTKKNTADNANLQEAIKQLKDIYSQLKIVDREAHSVAKNAERCYMQKLRDGKSKSDREKDIGCYSKTIRSQFKKSDIMWHYGQGLTLGVLICNYQKKRCIALSNGFIAFYPQDRVKELADKSLNLRHQFLKVFNDNKELEKYLLTSSNSQDAEKEIRSILKRTANYKNFTKSQCDAWNKYLKGKNSSKAKLNFYWDTLKIRVAQYMSNLQWKEIKDEKLLANELQGIRIKRGTADPNNKELNQVKKWVESYTPIEIKGEDNPIPKAQMNIVDNLGVD